MTKKVVLGRISTVFGVKGWVKIFSHTDPMEAILEYQPWLLGNSDRAAQDDEWQEVTITSGSRHSKGLIAHIKGVDDRESAQALVGKEIAIYRDQLPIPEEGEFYWADLEGVLVYNLEKQLLGYIHHLIATGSNDVMVVKGNKDSIDRQERLIPYLDDQVVKEVDLGSNVMIVDWDADF